METYIKFETFMKSWTYLNFLTFLKFGTYLKFGLINLANFWPAWHFWAAWYCRQYAINNSYVAIQMALENKVIHQESSWRTLLTPMMITKNPKWIQRGLYENHSFIKRVKSIPPSSSDISVLLMSQNMTNTWTDRQTQLSRQHLN